MRKRHSVFFVLRMFAPQDQRRIEAQEDEEEEEEEELPRRNGAEHWTARKKKEELEGFHRCWGRHVGGPSSDVD